MRDNSVTLVGNLVDDPELRFTPSGVAMAKISIAVNRRYQSNNEWQEETSFFRGTCWRDMAENAAESLQKGMRVIITGSLEQRTWETQEGDKRSIIELRIDDIGPSVRWATASVTRTPRTSGGGDWAGGQSSGGQSSGGQSSGGQSSGGGGTVPPAPVARDDYGPDEAPF